MIRTLVTAGLWAMLVSTSVATAADFSDQARNIAGGDSRLSLLGGCIAQVTAGLSGATQTEQTRTDARLRLDELRRLFDAEADRSSVPPDVAAEVLAIKLLPVETNSLTRMPPGMPAADPCTGA